MIYEEPLTRRNLLDLLFKTLSLDSVKLPADVLHLSSTIWFKPFVTVTHALALLKCLDKPQGDQDSKRHSGGNLRGTMKAFGVAFSLLIFFGMFATPFSVQAADKFCSDYGGVIDGNDTALWPTGAPVQITIDETCTFQNWPQSNPLATTINFQTNDPSVYLIIFDNVWYVGNMACSNISHKLWVVNSEEGAFSGSCQTIMIPAETIAKESPATTAAIGVPFTYTLTLPSMNYPAGDPSGNTIGSVVLTDDLTAIAAATGVELTYVSQTVYWKGGGTLSEGIDYIFSDGGGKNLTFTLPDILAGQQLIIDLTVVADDVAANSAGTTFTNIAEWVFSRSIDLDEDGKIDNEPAGVDLDGDGIFGEQEFFSPLPGESGVSTPMTIAEPNLVVTKSSPATALNLGDMATFTVDVENIGGNDAWNVQITDNLPVGMCYTDPTATLSASIVGTTSVTPLTYPGDYTLSPSPYDGSCQFILTMTDTGGPIAPNKHLIITYDTQIDPIISPDSPTDGSVLTNVAGATQWYSGDSTTGGRRTYGNGPGSLSNGTPGTPDFQADHSVTAALHGYYFEKTVTNLTSLEDPAITASPGDTLHYKLRVFNVDENIKTVQVTDPLDLSFFDPLTFGNVTITVGAGYSALWSFDASSGLYGYFTIAGAPELNVDVNGDLQVEFDITLRDDLLDNTEVSNQASLAAVGFNAFSDDPFVNGVASPDIDGDENATIVTIQTPGPPAKANPATTAVTVGELFTYTIKVPAAITDVPLYDVRIMDDLPANLQLVGTPQVISGGSWAVSNTGTGNSLILEDTATGIDIPANGQAEIAITVEVLNSLINQSSPVTTFVNSASYSYNRINGNVTSQTTGGSATTGNMTVVEPDLAANKTLSYISPAGKLPADPAMAGDIIEYSITITNNGNSEAFDVNIVDTLPANVSLVADAATATINGLSVGGFIVNPFELVPGTFAWGRANGDFSLDIAVGQSLILTYQLTVLAVDGTPISNSVYVDWSSLDGAVAAERNGESCPLVDALNDYCTGPATATVNTIDITAIAKVIVGDSYAETPASTGDPIVRVGDTATYELTLSLQEYTTRSVVVEDTLPAGMVLDSFNIIAGANFTYSMVSQPPLNSSGSLTWDFGDITNLPNDGLPDDLVISYVARVVTAAPPTGVDYNNTSIQLDNLAKLSYAGGDPALNPTRLTSTDRVDVRQPQMRTITKTDIGTGRLGSGSQTNPYQISLADDVMQFRLSTCNDGLAPAYNLRLTDQLPGQLDETSITTPLVTLAGITLTAVSDYTYSPPVGRGGTVDFVLNIPVIPGECLTVDYNIGFHTDLTVQETFSNTAQLNEYFSLASLGRSYTPPDTAQVWMTNLASPLALSKTLVSPANGEATIGEEVDYQIKVPAIPVNIALNNVVVNDSLHGALEYLGASAVDIGGNPVGMTIDTSALPQLSMTITSIPAGQQAIITLRTRVANNGQAQAGTSFGNTASYTYTGMPPGTVTSFTSGPLTIIEPQVSVTKSASTTSPRPGDILTYTLTFTAAGNGPGDNFSDSFDLIIEDDLGIGQLYESGSATLNGAPLTDPQTNGGDGVTVAELITWGPAANDIDILEGGNVTVTYRAQILSGVSPGQTLTNSVVGRWSGLDGDQSPIERTGSGVPPVNDYFTQPVNLSLITQLDVSIAKSVINETSGEDPGANASPEDTLLYTLVLSNGSVIAADNLTLVDQLSPYFAGGTLQLVNVPASSDKTGTNPTGGANGTGIVDIRGLTLAAQGDPGGNDSLTITFRATLAPVLDNNTTVLNQAQLSGPDLAATTSNQTSTQIGSAPQFEVKKTSEDLTADPAELIAGDSLRYTITVRNIGNENAVNMVLRDQIPANTTYTPSSTTLNGAPVADPTAGVSPLQDGLLINPPTDPTSGFMPADVPPSADHTATITFDVVVNNDVLNGTIIANQAFLTGDGSGSGPIQEVPSDDPGTTVPDDPTRDVVGNLPLVDVLKTVEIVTDGGSLGILDPGDTIRYTITITNAGAIPATGVVFTDSVPADTIYMDNTVELNGLPVRQPDNGISPLIAGIPVSSSDLTPSLPTAGNGTLAAGSSAVITFEVQVTGAPGTVITNQGIVTTNELPDEPTDSDNIDSNGDQPTLIVVGPDQELTISKEVFPVGGNAALAGGQLDYVLKVTNIGTVPATDVIVTDDLSGLAGLANYVAGSGVMNGSQAGVSYTGSTLTADYFLQSGSNLPPGSTIIVRFRVQIDPAVAIGTTIDNTGMVSWNSATRNDSAAISIDVGGVPGTGTLIGSLWHDTNLDKTFDSTEISLADWSVELYRNGQLLTTVLSGSDGIYRISGLPASTDQSDLYELRFRAPGAVSNTASLGQGDSIFTNGPQKISGISVTSGGSHPNLNLPLAPNGTVYNSVLRVPVAGAELVLLNGASGTTLPDQCFDDPAQQHQITTASGFYKFDLNFSDPACPPGDAYLIEVTAPATGYSSMPSQIIPPASDWTTAPFSVPACPGNGDDAVPATLQYCEVTATALTPPDSVLPRTVGTVYHTHLILDNGIVPGQSQIFNNPIPIDPELNGAVAISKTSSMLNVRKGQLVPYTITVTNVLGAPLFDMGIVDHFPAGFKYVRNSARLDGVPSEPTGNDRELFWGGLLLQTNEKHTIQLLLVVGAGVDEDEYVNRAQVINTLTGGAVSGEASATVQVIPDPDLDCTDVIGKVFNDRDQNGYQDSGDKGLAGVRVVTARGLISTTDKDGRFHISCAAVPDQDRGSNFVLKLDERSLPSGYRVTTENPRVQRATRGKMLRFNFGATIHRVVRIDISAGVFESGSSKLRLQWQPKIKRLIEALKEAPSILHLSYLADVERESLVEERLSALKKEITALWQRENGGYLLAIEKDVFWRRGAPFRGKD